MTLRRLIHLFYRINVRIYLFIPTPPRLTHVFSPSEGRPGKRTRGGDAHLGHDAVRLDRLRGHEARGHLAVLQEER